MRLEEAKDVAGNVIPPEETGLTLSRKIFVVTNILEIFVIAKEERHQQLQHCNAVTEFKQVENKASNHVFRK